MDTSAGTTAPTTDTVRAGDGTTLRVHRWGAADRPPVVLVHGMGLSSGSWGQVPDLLVLAGHRVVAYDLRGHADSGPAATGDYRLATHGRDLGAVLDATLAPGERAVLVGHSLGGAILLAHVADAGTGRVQAAVFPGSSGSVVTVPGFPAHRLPDRAEELLATTWLGMLQGGLALAKRLSPLRPVVDRVTRWTSFAEGASDDVVQRVGQDFLGTRRQALARTMLGSIRQDGSDLAPALDVPALVVRGSADPEVSAADAHDLLSALPDGLLVQIPDAGHILPLTHPQLVADQVVAWARRSSAR